MVQMPLQIDEIVMNVSFLSQHSDMPDHPLSVQIMVTAVPDPWIGLGLGRLHACC